MRLNIFNKSTNLLKSDEKKVNRFSIFTLENYCVKPSEKFSLFDSTSAANTSLQVHQRNFHQN